MNIGDVITTAEGLAEVPFGAVVLFEDATGIAVYTKTGPREWNAVLISTFLPVTVLYLPGRVPRPERAVKAEALREAAALVDAECPHEPDEHAEGSCDLCDFTFAVTAQLHERADLIEAGDAL